MKKIMYFLFAAIFLFSFAGCNQKVENETLEENPNMTEEKTDGKEKKEEHSLQDILLETMYTLSSVDSFSVNMEIEQEVMENPTSEPIHMNMTLEMDVTTNPEAVHQKLSMFVPDFEETYETEVYFTDQGYFMYEPFTKTWMKMPEDMFQQLNQIPKEKTNPYMQIQQFKKFIEDFSLQANSSEYILSLRVSGDEFFDYVQEETFDLLNGEDDALIKELMNSTSVNQLDYTIRIDNETFLLKQVEMVMQLEVVEQGEELSFFHKSTTTYKNFNTIDKIIVPEDIVNSAKENDF